MSVKKRIFIVGCPRSGTTLLQGMLAAHSDVYSLPETFFFAKVRPRNWIKRNLLWSAVKVRSYLPALVKEMGREDLLPMCNIGLFQRDYHVPFVNVMDRMALDAGKTIWVEKTPMHLYAIDEIQKKIPDAKIIHIVRNGPDVVASLIKATREYPAQWAKFGGWWRRNWKGYTIETAVARWNLDFMISKRKIGATNHLVVRFEDVVNNPKKMALTLCNFLDLSFEEGMCNPSTTVQQIVRQDEPWKANNAKPIGQRQSLFDKMFTMSEQAHIKRLLLPYDI